MKRQTYKVTDTLDTLTQAIDSNLQVKFKYSYYDEKKKKRFRKKADTDGFYFVSPYKLIYSDDNYFLLAYDNSDRKPKMKHFRVDKMDVASVVLAEREGQEAYEAITDIDNYSSYTFSMHGGDVKNVTLGGCFLSPYSQNPRCAALHSGFFFTVYFLLQTRASSRNPSSAQRSAPQ